MHAVLAAVPLDATRVAIAEAAELQERVLGAGADETAAAREIVGAVLARPSWRGRPSRAGGAREKPPWAVSVRGAPLEGILELA